MKRIDQEAQDRWQADGGLRPGSWTLRIGRLHCGHPGITKLATRFNSARSIVDTTRNEQFVAVPEGRTAVVAELVAPMLYSSVTKNSQLNSTFGTITYHGSSSSTTRLTTPQGALYIRGRLNEGPPPALNRFEPLMMLPGTHSKPILVEEDEAGGSCGGDDDSVCFGFDAVSTDSIETIESLSAIARGVFPPILPAFSVGPPASFDPDYEDALPFKDS